MLVRNLEGCQNYALMLTFVSVVGPGEGRVSSKVSWPWAS